MAVVKNKTRLKSTTNNSRNSLLA